VRPGSHAVQFNKVYPHGLASGHVRASSAVRIKPSSLDGLRTGRGDPRDHGNDDCAGNSSLD
jgi:hypothetical protein